MEQQIETSTPSITPESVSPTSNWGKPTFKKKLAIKRRLTLNRDTFGTRSICPPNVQPKLNRINPDESELLEAMEGLSTIRRIHSQTFNCILNK